MRLLVNTSKSQLCPAAPTSRDDSETIKKGRTQTQANSGQKREGRWGLEPAPPTEGRQPGTRSPQEPPKCESALTASTGGDNACLEGFATDTPLNPLKGL